MWRWALATLERHRPRDADAAVPPVKKGAWESVNGVWDRASTYLGAIVLALVLVDRRMATWLFPLSLAVCAYGTVDTFLCRDVHWWWRMASVCGHVALPALCMVRDDPRVTLEALVLAACVLLLVLGVYVALGHWPYHLSREASFALMMVLCAGLLQHVLQRPQ